ncbi:hypothetical protein [Aequorivita sp. CIP111184]|uniref:hypothetical protein n=1 Tax=Aequorivita sp. CIP111184 TaxID=2211356 RepID=UPI0011BE9D5F|nr:hypothetical protein [Aequorivita sp. CIP111184]
MRLPVKGSDNSKNSPYEIIIAHELGHQIASVAGNNSPLVRAYLDTPWFTFTSGDGIVTNENLEENFTLNFENFFRNLLNLPLRTHYMVQDGIPVEKSRVFTGPLSNPIFVDDN